MSKSVITAANPTFEAPEGSAAVARFNISPGLTGPAKVLVRVEGWGASPGTDFGVLKVSFDGTHFTTVEDGVVIIPAGATKMFLSADVKSDNLSHEPGESIAFVVAQSTQAYDLLEGSYYVSSVATLRDTTPEQAKISGASATVAEGEYAVGQFNLDVPLAFATRVLARVEGYGITLGQDTSGSMQVRINGSGGWSDVTGGQIQLPAGTTRFELRVATLADGVSEHAETMNFVVAQTDHLLRDSYYVSSLVTVEDVSGSSAPSSSGQPGDSAPSAPPQPGQPEMPPHGSEPEGDPQAPADPSVPQDPATPVQPSNPEVPEEEPVEDPSAPGEMPVDEPVDDPVEEPVAEPEEPEEPEEPSAPGTVDAGGNNGADKTFTVTEQNGVLTFGGTAAGEVTILVNNDVALFIRDGVLASETIDSISTKLIDSGSSLVHFNIFGSEGNDSLKFKVHESADPHLIPNLMTLRGDLFGGADKISLVFPDAPGAAQLEPTLISSVAMKGGNDTLEAIIQGTDDSVLLHAGSVLSDFESITSAAGARFNTAEAAVAGTPARAGSTFTVSESNNAVTFGGTATGEITVIFQSNGAATFSRGGVVASAAVQNMASKTINSAESVTLMHVLGTNGDDTLKIRVNSATDQLVLRGSLGEGSDTVLLSFPNVPAAEQDRRKVIVNSLIELFDADDAFIVQQDDAQDRIILDDGSVLADFESFNIGPANLEGVTFIGVLPPAPAN